MLNYRRAASLMVLATAPVLAMAQTTPPKPSPQQTASPAPTKAAAPASSESKRFVTNENFYRAGAQPQPAASAPTGTQPVVGSTANPALRPNFAPVPRPGIPQPLIPAVAASIPPQPQSAAITGSSVAVDHEASAAVDYASGQLTVVAEHAPLGHVLKLIAEKTGAQVDLAPELQQEPVMARLGPAPVREVLTGLLDSPRVDYIVFGSGDEPGSLQRIVVRKRQSFGSMAMGGLRPQQPQQQEMEGNQAGPNGQVISRRNVPGQSEMTQEQRMEEWNKQRAQMLDAEVKQQAQDRENERYQAPEPPAPQEVPQQQDNPPQL
jgi:hypothetical protein